jgi:hypothetical protein
MALNIDWRAAMCKNSPHCLGALKTRVCLKPSEFEQRL